jgi:hypothetical protein
MSPIASKTDPVLLAGLKDRLIDKSEMFRQPHQGLIRPQHQVKRHFFFNRPSGLRVRVFEQRPTKRIPGFFKFRSQK